MLLNQINDRSFREHYFANLSWQCDWLTVLIELYRCFQVDKCHVRKWVGCCILLFDYRLHTVPHGVTCQQSTESSRPSIRIRYLGHVTGYQPIRGQYFMILSGFVSPVELLTPIMNWLLSNHW